MFRSDPGSLHREPANDYVKDALVAPTRPDLEADPKTG